MFLAANPEKARSAEEQEDLLKRYKHGDEVLPKVQTRTRTRNEALLEDADRRLMEEVRDLSLREVGVESSEARRERRRREDGRSRSSRVHSSRENSMDRRRPEERERRRRRDGDSERRAIDDSSTLRPDGGQTTERRRRRSEGESRRREDERSRNAAHRQIEHQSSLRSLISSSDIDSHEMEEEILRQIREEGLLDGIDLENIDVNQEDQISERIAEAFKRRQEQQRSRQDPARREAPSGRRRRAASESRDTSGEEGSRTLRTRRTHARSTSAVGQGDEPRRPPMSSSAGQAAHLEAQSSDEGRRRRRATSNGRSATSPLPLAEIQARPAARSQTDLSERPRSSQVALPSRPLVATGNRSNTDLPAQRGPERSTSDLASREGTSRRSISRSPRIGANPDSTQPPASALPRLVPAVEIVIPDTSSLAMSTNAMDRSLMPAPLSPRSPSHSREGSLSDRSSALQSGSRPTSSSSVTTKPPRQYYNEPSLKCSRCSKPHIEYELHYNCKTCHGGAWNLCLSCYRSGAGCLHWFGFGYVAWAKFQRQIESGDLPANAEKPHMLTANRYLQPKVQAGGADGRRTLTTEDPFNRLQSGAFCANCLAWANECYWRCESCNDGDWGFCNVCVNQGKSCNHALLPLTYKPFDSYVAPLSPAQDHRTPASATILTGPGINKVGPFVPLTFSTNCDICHYPIQPSNTRYHCYSCTSAVPDTLPGDYDICTTCYAKLVSSRRISSENGSSGWRRCLRGHRMVIVGFEDSRGGQRRVVVQELVGGYGLHEDLVKTDPELLRWSWGQGDSACVRLVTRDVSRTAPDSMPGMETAKIFPPNGGVGMASIALWSWYPKHDADDELMFPRGSEVCEVQDVNGDWFHGAYMGKTGLFPAPYVKFLE
ncbi:hypothetical protein BP6252_01600 [Coleophoma cylindrospora]|uniref:SH3 domain-containing protein n=1 Tax=Coleophoma cylindrospora TaxID=1849047 RepID=A0A3D8SUV9_9HELO|nr:hypothetical protein BP6252_01600 [Coleophoma cylindrospora]